MAAVCPNVTFCTFSLCPCWFLCLLFLNKSILYQWYAVGHSGRHKQWHYQAAKTGDRFFTRSKQPGLLTQSWRLSWILEKTNAIFPATPLLPKDLRGSACRFLDDTRHSCYLRIFSHYNYSRSSELSMIFFTYWVRKCRYRGFFCTFCEESSGG